MVNHVVTHGIPSDTRLAEGWTAVTRDRSLSAQLEHSVGMTEDGGEIFTLSSIPG